MMLKDVAQALTTALFAAGFTTAERRYLPRRKLEDYDTLRISVVARADDVDVAEGTRAARLHTYTVDVAYQQRIAAIEEAAMLVEIDAHESRVEALMAALDPDALITVGGAKVVGLTRYAGEEAPYSMKQLTEHRLYTAVVKVTLEEYREAA